MKKIIIIGGGIAGLSAGYHAQKYGFESVIYEKHSILGGECTGWDRKGYHIDGCIRWLTGTKEGSDLNALWREVGAFKQEEIIQLDNFGTYECEGTNITLWKDLDRLREEFLQISPEDKAAIEEFLNDIKAVQTMDMPAEKPVSMMSPIEIMRLIKGMKGAGSVLSKLGKTSFGEYAKRFKSPVIRCLFDKGMPSGFSIIALIFGLGTFTSGNGAIPKGGSRQMALNMGQRYTEMGGKVVCGVSADEIIINNGIATAVRFSDGSIIKADYIIATCDTKVTFDKLLKGNYKDKKFEMRYNNPKDYPLASAVQIAFGVTENLSNYPTQLDFPTETYRVATCENHSLTFVNYAYEKSFAPEGCSVAITIIGQSDADYFYWDKLYQDKEAYQKEKQKIAAEVLERVEKKFPELKGKITILDVSTPKTYERYANAYHGAYMSFMMTPNSKRMSHNGKIKGLKNFYLSGQWLEPPGGLPVAVVNGKFTVMRIAKKEKCLKI